MNVRRVSLLVVAVLIATGISSVGALAQYRSGTACPSPASVCPAPAAELCPPSCPPTTASVVCPVPCPPPCPEIVAQAPCPAPCPPPAPVAVCPPPCPPVTVAQAPCPPEPCPAPVATCPAPSPCPPGPSALSACTQTLIGYNRGAEMCVEGSVVTGAGLANATDVDSQMTIKTADGREHRVWLAPNSYLCNYGFNPAVGDSVAVTGAPTGSEGDIIARQIMWRNSLFAFRSPEGVPMWATRDANFVSYASMWNSGRLVTFSGRIDKIYEFSPGCPEVGSGVALRVRVNGQDWETVPSWQRDGRPIYATVHLGPSWYVNERIARLRKGQMVTVTGSSVTWDGQCVVIACQAQHGSCVVAFRDTAGRPLWAGGWQNWGPGTRYAGLYDPGYMRTISGSIESMQSFGPVDGMKAGTMLAIKTTDGATVHAALIPEWSAETAGVQLQQGEQVTIAGPSGVLNGQQVLIASHLQVSGRILALQECGTLCLWTPALVCPPTMAVAAQPASIVSACPTGACF